MPSLSAAEEFACEWSLFVRSRVNCSKDRSERSPPRLEVLVSRELGDDASWPGVSHELRRFDPRALRRVRWCRSPVLRFSHLMCALEFRSGPGRLISLCLSSDLDSAISQDASQFVRRHRRVL